jgi:outer membrane receptor for ferrienterochelin and colicin
LNFRIDPTRREQVLLTLECHFIMQNVFMPFPGLLLFASMTVLQMLPLKPVQAQESSVTTLDPIVVTGSAHSTQIRQATQSVTILKTEELAPLQPNRVTTMLQQVRGSILMKWGEEVESVPSISEGATLTSP